MRNAKVKGIYMQTIYAIKSFNTRSVDNESSSKLRRGSLKDEVVRLDKAFTSNGDLQMMSAMHSQHPSQHSQQRKHPRAPSKQSLPREK